MTPPGQSSGPGKGQRALPGPFLVMDTAFLRILSWDPATLFPEVGPVVQPKTDFKSSLEWNCKVPTSPQRLRETQNDRVRKQCQ